MQLKYMKNQSPTTHQEYESWGSTGAGITEVDASGQ